MEKIKQLPSGNWNIRKYDYTDAAGKKHYRSFTGPTKTDVRKAVNAWLSERDREAAAAVTIAEAVSGYIDLKRSALSPSTIRAYDGIYNNYIEDNPVSRIRTDALTTMAAQRWISGLIAKDLSPKTIRNAYGLLTAAVQMYEPDLKLRVTLPQKEQPDLHCPDDKELKLLLDTVRANGDRVMEFAILCAAFIPARRGEICALTYDDVDGDRITISKSIVKNTDNGWELKAPKTYGSYRTVQVPPSRREDEPDVARMLTLSTHHVTKETADMLLEEANDMPGSSHNFPAVFTKGDYGYMVNVPDDYLENGEDGVKENYDTPDDLHDCILLAVEHHCQWLCLDRDGKVMKGLPVFDW